MDNEASGPTPKEMGIDSSPVRDNKPDSQQQDKVDGAAGNSSHVNEDIVPEAGDDTHSGSEGTLGSDGDRQEVSGGNQRKEESEGPAEGMHDAPRASEEQEFEALSDEEKYSRLIEVSREIIKRGIDSSAFKTKKEQELAGLAFQNPNNSRAVLETLGVLEAYTVDAPEESGQHEDIVLNIGRVKDFVRVSDKGEARSITDLEAEKASSSDKARVVEIDKLLKEGTYEPEFKVEEEPAVEQFKTQGELDISLNKALPELEALAKKERLSEEDSAAFKDYVSILKKVNEDYNGEESGIIKVSVLKGIRSTMKKAGVDTDRVDGLIAKSEGIGNEDLQKIAQHMMDRGLGADRTEGFMSAASEGNIDELMDLLPRYMDKRMGKMLFGKDFESDQKASDFINELMHDPTKMEILKKRAGQVGFMAALILIGAGIAGEMSGGVVSGEKR